MGSTPTFGIIVPQTFVPGKPVVGAKHLGNNMSAKQYNRSQMLRPYAIKERSFLVCHS